MAYREVRMMDIDKVIRRWLAGEKIRAIARLTGSTEHGAADRAFSGGGRNSGRDAVAGGRQATSSTAAHGPARCGSGHPRGRRAAEATNRADSSLAGQRPSAADQSARTVGTRGTGGLL